MLSNQPWLQFVSQLRSYESTFLIESERERAGQAAGSLSNLEIRFDANSSTTVFLIAQLDFDRLMSNHNVTQFEEELTILRIVRLRGESFGCVVSAAHNEVFKTI